MGTGNPPGRPRIDGLPPGSMMGEAELRRRRRKADHDGRNFRMRAPKIPGYATRWANDTGTRIHKLTVEDDWDFVEKSEIESLEGVDVGDPILAKTIDPGGRVSIPIDLGGGVVAKAYLLKKRQEWFDSDKAENAKLRRAKRDAALSNHGVDRGYGNTKVEPPSF